MITHDTVLRSGKTYGEMISKMCVFIAQDDFVGMFEYLCDQHGFVLGKDKWDITFEFFTYYSTDGEAYAERYISPNGNVGESSVSKLYTECILDGDDSGFIGEWEIKERVEFSLCVDGGDRIPISMKTLLDECAVHMLRMAQKREGYNCCS